MKNTIYKTDNFRLFTLQENDQVLLINREFEDGQDALIGMIFYNTEKEDCYFTTNGSNLQDYIVDWDLYVDFVKCLDIGFDYFNLKETE